MNKLTAANALSPDQRRLLQQLLQESVVVTEARMQALGIDVGKLLDPEDAIQTQVTQLRYMFLVGEQAALKFAPADPNHWRVIRARLQPIVLAYQTHERFVQSVLNGVDPKSDEALMAIYKERLQNSERFREIFFKLNERLQAEGRSFDNLDIHETHKNQFRTEDDAALIQQNVLTQLSKQIKTLEKKEQEQQKNLAAKDKELAAVIEERDRTRDQLEKSEREVNRLRDESINLRLSADAAQRGLDPESMVAPSLIESPDDGNTANYGREQVYQEGDAAALQQRVTELEEEVESTSNAAYNAYMASSDMSIVILFMLSSFQVTTFDRLGTEIVRTVSTYGLKPTVSVLTDTGPKYFSGAQAISNAESLIESRRQRGRIVEEGSMLFIYEERVVLLIQDMPINDRPRFERLRDNLSTLIKGASARAEAVMLASAAEKQKVQMERLLTKSDDVFKGINKNLEKQSLKLTRLLQLASQDLRSGLGINPGDPKSITLTGRLKKMEESMRGLFNPDELVDPAFTRNVAKVAANIKEKEKQS